VESLTRDDLHCVLESWPLVASYPGPEQAAAGTALTCSCGQPTRWTATVPERSPAARRAWSRFRNAPPGSWACGPSAPGPRHPRGSRPIPPPSRAARHPGSRRCRRRCWHAHQRFPAGCHPRPTRARGGQAWRQTGYRRAARPAAPPRACRPRSPRPPGRRPSPRAGSCHPARRWPRACRRAGRRARGPLGERLAIEVAADEDHPVGPRVVAPGPVGPMVEQHVDPLKHVAARLAANREHALHPVEIDSLGGQELPEPFVELLAVHLAGHLDPHARHLLVVLVVGLVGMLGGRGRCLHGPDRPPKPG